MTKGIPLGRNDILVDRDESGIAVIRINRQEKRNALTLAMWKELRRLLAEFGTDRNIRVVILSGCGDSFSAGADISEFPVVRSTTELIQAYESTVENCIESLLEMPKPSVAAISGACMGGGFSLALACDFRVADATAYFSIPAARLGVVYSISKCYSLLALVGLSRAKRILLSGSRLNLGDVKSWGIIDEEAVDVLDAARTLARELTLSAPLSVAGMKAILNAIAHGEVTRKLPELERSIRVAETSKDYQEAIMAFSQKRPPIFRGL